MSNGMPSVTVKNRARKGDGNTIREFSVGVQLFIATIALVFAQLIEFNPSTLALPVYRFFNNNAGGHFFTISEAEKNTLIQNKPWFRFEHIGFYAYPAQLPGTLPVYRFFNNNAGGYCFTIDEAEKNTVIQNYPWLRYERIGFYAYPTHQSGTLPVYRFINSKAGGDFLTIDEAEKNTVIQNYPWLRYEGISFYAYPSP